MPEEAHEEVLAASRPSGRKVGPVALAGVVVIIALVGAAFMILRGGRLGSRHIDKGEQPLHPKEILDIPVLEISDILLSVPVGEAGAQRKGLIVGVTVRFAPPEGERVNVKVLQKEFVPRVINLSAEFRHLVIEVINTKDYSQLANAGVRNEVLKTLKGSFDDKLKQYGLRQMAGVSEVLWKDFYWQ